MSSTEDLKTLRNWVVGVIAFASAISTFLIQVFSFEPAPTLVTMTIIAVFFITVTFLIMRAEKRSAESLKAHKSESDAILVKFTERLDNINNTLIEIQRSTLRTEMGLEMTRSPENHDTILRMAERYFLPIEQGGLDGDWYMSSMFLEWAEKENIKLPQSLADVHKK